jgi:hypothetical protein
VDDLLKKTATMADLRERAALRPDPWSLQGDDYQRVRRKPWLSQVARPLLLAPRASQRLDLKPKLPQLPAPLVLHRLNLPALRTTWHRRLLEYTSSKLLGGALGPCTFVYLALLALLMGAPVGATLLASSLVTLTWLNRAQLYDILCRIPCPPADMRKPEASPPQA